MNVVQHICDFFSRKFHIEGVGVINGVEHHFQQYINSKTNKLAELDHDSVKDVFIGHLPSTSVKVFRKIGWVSIPAKSIKVL